MKFDDDDDDDKPSPVLSQRVKAPSEWLYRPHLGNIIDHNLRN